MKKKVELKEGINSESMYKWLLRKSLSGLPVISIFFIYLLIIGEFPKKNPILIVDYISQIQVALGPNEFSLLILNMLSLILAMGLYSGTLIMPNILKRNKIIQSKDKFIGDSIHVIIITIFMFLVLIGGMALIRKTLITIEYYEVGFLIVWASYILIAAAVATALIVIRDLIETSSGKSGTPAITFGVSIGLSLVSVVSLEEQISQWWIVMFLFFIILTFALSIGLIIHKVYDSGINK